MTVLAIRLLASIRQAVEVDGEWIHLFKIQNGKVVSFRDYGDTHAMVQAYFGGDIHSVTVAPSAATARFQH